MTVSTVLLSVIVGMDGMVGAKFGVGLVGMVGPHLWWYPAPCNCAQGFDQLAAVFTELTKLTTQLQCALSLDS